MDKKQTSTEDDGAKIDQVLYISDKCIEIAYNAASKKNISLDEANKIIDLAVKSFNLATSAILFSEQDNFQELYDIGFDDGYNSALDEGDDDDIDNDKNNNKKD